MVFIFAFQILFVKFRVLLSSYYKTFAVFQVVNEC